MGEPSPLAVGDRIEVAVGAPAAGGSCVARLDGRVVFVRHALPGERAVAAVTEDRGGYLFADAVEILEASPDRVTPPCPHAGPGRCGGCDFQHATGGAQRAMKEAVIREQFRRLAGIDLGGTFAGVAELPGGLLGWRTRNLYAVDGDGWPGLRRHRSAEVERLDRCLIGVPGVGDAPTLAQRWPGLSGVEVARGDDGATAVLAHRPGRAAAGRRRARGRRPPDRVEVVAGPAELVRHVGGREFRVAAEGFWQVHPAALDTFTGALLAATDPRPGERVLELYAGAGALTAALASAVGDGGTVTTLEAAPRAVADARANLSELSRVRVERGVVSTASVAAAGAQGVDVAVLDPPRAGAGREVIDALLGLQPRVIGYLACDPAALARDVATAARAGWRLASLQAFDAFPMTHHVECVAGLIPAAGHAR